MRKGRGEPSDTSRGRAGRGYAAAQAAGQSGLLGGICLQGNKPSGTILDSNMD